MLFKQNFANILSMADPAASAINKRIKEIRTVLGLSQVKFSSIIPLSSSYIAGVETNHIPVSDRLVKLVCSTFNVNESWLRYGEGDMFSDALIEDKRFNNLVNTVRALPPKYQDFLFEMLDMLVKLKEK